MLKETHMASGMVTGRAPSFALEGLENLRKSWGWVLALGVALIALGTVALGAAVFTTVASVMFFGWLLIIAGVAEVVHGFVRRAWQGFFLDLLTGVLYFVVGLMFVVEPLQSAATLTLLLAAALLFAGAMRIVLALSTQFQHWVWLLLNGIVTLALGILIWRGWPETGYWVIGMFIGIDLLFYGWSLVMLSVGLRSLPAQTT
jgi:uncharacterized membrane protein HdeD (DUF308 family)